MGLIWRRSIRVNKRTRVNLSKTGASATTRIGPFTVNSRGKISIRLGKGLSWRL